MLRWLRHLLATRRELRRRIWELEGQVFMLEREGAQWVEENARLVEENESLWRYRRGETASAKLKGSPFTEPELEEVPPPLFKRPSRKEIKSVREGLRRDYESRKHDN